MKYNYIDIAKNIVLSNIDINKYDVFLFGSRATGSFHEMSDIDIGISGSKPLDALTKINLKDALDESIVPFRVDIVDFYKATPDFKKVALEKLIYWNKRSDTNT